MKTAPRGVPFFFARRLTGSVLIDVRPVARARLVDVGHIAFAGLADRRIVAVAHLGNRGQVAGAGLDHPGQVVIADLVDVGDMGVAGLAGVGGVVRSVLPDRDRVIPAIVLRRARAVLGAVLHDVRAARHHVVGDHGHGIPVARLRDGRTVKRGALLADRQSIARAGLGRLDIRIGAACLLHAGDVAAAVLVDDDRARRDDGLRDGGIVPVPALCDRGVELTVHPHAVLRDPCIVSRAVLAHHGGHAEVGVALEDAGARGAGAAHVVVIAGLRDRCADGRPRVERRQPDLFRGSGVAVALLRDRDGLARCGQAGASQTDAKCDCRECESHEVLLEVDRGGLESDSAAPNAERWWPTCRCRTG